jgi:hypothetical protein
MIPLLDPAIKAVNDLATSRYSLNDPILNRPSNKIEAEMSYPLFITTVAGRELIVSYLEQQFLETQNVPGKRGFINPAAHAGLIPFQQGKVSYYLPIPDIKLPSVSDVVNALVPTAPLGLQSADFGTPLPQALKEENQRENLKKEAAKQEEILKSLTSNVCQEVLDERLLVHFSKQDETTDLAVKNGRATLINFYISSLNYNSDSPINTMGLQTYISALTESHVASWPSIDIVSAVHPLYIQTNTSRNISIDFTIVTTCEEEILKLRDKINWLTKHTYPVYNESKTAKQAAPMISLTLGSLYKNLKGYISSLNYDHNALNRWDITEMDKLVITQPQGVRVSMNFVALEDEAFTNQSDSKIYT